MPYGATWSTAAAGLQSSGATTNLETFTIVPVITQYVRLVGHGNSVNTWNSFTEVRILTNVPVSSSETTAVQLAVAEEAEEGDGLTVYPNPAISGRDHHIRLSCSAMAGPVKVSLQDQQGVTLYTGNDENAKNALQLPLPLLHPGLYIVRVTGERNTWMRRIWIRGED